MWNPDFCSADAEYARLRFVEEMDNRLDQFRPAIAHPRALIKSTQAMRDRIRELTCAARDDYDRAVECVVDDLEELLGVKLDSGPPCGECHLQPAEVCDICGKSPSTSELTLQTRPDGKSP